MKRGLLASVILSCVVCFGAFAAVLAAGWSPHLGLDLEGGLQVVYVPVHKATPAQLDTVVSIMQQRANGLGLANPNIGTQGDTVVVQLPGVKDPQVVLRTIGSTAQLFFRPVLCSTGPYVGSGSSKSSTPTTTSPSAGTTTPTTAPSGSTGLGPAPGGRASTTSANLGAAGARAASYVLPTTAAAGTARLLANTTTTAPGTTTVPATTPAAAPTSTSAARDGFVAPAPCSPQSQYTVANYNAATQSFQPPAPDTALQAYPSTTPIQNLPSRTVLLCAATPCNFRYVLGPVPVDPATGTPASGAILASADATLSQTQGWVINFTIKSQYSAFFDTIAKANYHLPLAIDLGAYVVSAPTINTTSFGGSGQISGSFTQQTADNLALVLKYGAIPVALKQQTATTVSPSLGKQSLRAGLLAGLVGLLLVMVYMVLYYRALGIVVILGLITTGCLLYAIISILGETSGGLTLDLSGITGLIVSIGITVDSYVVYFERLKDEVRAGRSVRSSVDRGFQSAYRTILSADAISFLGALVLWLLSIGAVRGFAFMLGLSTLVDVLSAYFFTRPFVILLGRNRIFTEARGLGVARGLGAPAEAA